MIRILDHPWHLAHAYRLHALPARFDWYPVGPRFWDEGIRPRPANWGGFVEKPDPVGYDLILSHIDNWCDRTPLRATPYRVMAELASQVPHIPRVTIMHGTPDNEQNRQAIHRLLAGAPGGMPYVVCNSQQAARDWGFPRGRAIIHGYDVDEFGSERERMRIAATVCSAGWMSEIYHGVPLLRRIKRDVDVLWIGANGDAGYFPSYLEYREFLAALLIYVHPGAASPMPGARTEAMLSGACVVTTSNQDADRCIEHGVTGFLCDTAEAMIDTIRMLLADPALAYRVGKAGREAARAFFHKDRYVADWLSLLAELGVKR